MGYDYLIGFLVVSGILANWWFAMFSDSGAGQMARGMNKIQRHGKNVTALFLPGFGMGAAFLMVLKISVDLGVAVQLGKVFGVIGIAMCCIGFLGFLPIPLPRWMYPEYHLARRERVRAERLARGEVVKMPSSGRVAVEAQRLEQIVREREAAQRADKDSSR